METTFKQQIQKEILELNCKHVEAIKMKYLEAQARAEALQVQIKMLQEELYKLYE